MENKKILYLEYLGFDPSTSSLLTTHASDCANTLKAGTGFSTNLVKNLPCSLARPSRFSYETALKYLRICVKVVLRRGQFRTY